MASIAAALTTGAPAPAHAQVVCSGSPVTCSGTQTTTVTITSAQSPLTFDSGTNVTTSAGPAVSATQSGAFDITNRGTLIGASGALESFLRTGGPATLTNFGTIGATTGALRGIQFNNGGSITNEVGGQILGSDRGIDGNGNPITVINSGTITGANLQGIASNGGNVTNEAGGTITGGTTGVQILGNAVLATNTVTNAGTITGGIFSVLFNNSQQNVLTLLTGSVLNGIAQGNGSRSSLVLQGSGIANNQFVAFGSLNVQASGTWALNGNSDIGAATVNSGTLVIGDAAHSAANLTGSVIVNSGGALGGQGTVTGDVTVASGGTIAPGAASPFSTLNVTGGVSFATGSFFKVNANALGQNDKLVLGGAAILTGGTVQVLAQGSGFAANTPYTILHAAGGFGGTTFADITSNFAFLTPSLSYDTANNDVLLNLALNNSGGGDIFGSVAQTPNQRAVAAALSAAPPNGTLFNALINQNVAGAQQALTALSGDVYSNGRTVQADNSQLLRSAILGRLEQAAYSSGSPSDPRNALGFAGPGLAFASTGFEPQSRPAFPTKTRAPAGDSVQRDLTFWTQGFGGFDHFASDGNATGANGRFAGILTGVDAAFGSATRLGLATGYTRSDVGSGASGLAIDSAHFAAYAGQSLGGSLHVRGGLSYTFDTTDSNRTVAFPGFLDITKAHFDGHVGQVFGEIGYGVALGRVALEPLAGLAYVAIHQGAFTESGGAAALSGTDTSENIGYSSLGARVASVVPLADGTALSPHGSVQWQHAFGEVTPITALAFQSTGTASSIAGVPIAQDAALLQGGVDWRFSKSMKVTFDYQGTLAASAQTHSLKGVFSWNF